MQYIIFFVIIFNLYLHAVRSGPDVKDYFILVNNDKCALLSLSADLYVEYETTHGMNIVKVPFENTSHDQSGICSTITNNTTAIFNITINNYGIVGFYFENINNEVILLHIMFTYHLPNINFPNAIMKGTIVTVAKINQTLSISNHSYQCFSLKKFELFNNVTFLIYGFKVKVFNVFNNSYGEEISECSQDIIMSSSSSTITSGKPVTTSNAKSISTNNKLITETSLTQGSTTVLTSTIASNDTKFEISDGKNICLLLQGKMTLVVRYETSNKNVTKVFLVMLPIGYNGTCSQNENNIIIYFGPKFYFQLIFTKKKKIVKLNTFKTYIYLTSQFFPNAKYQNSIMVNTFMLGSSYEVKLGKGYSCKNNLTFGNSTINLETMDFKFEAFRSSNSFDFIDMKPTQCSNSLTIGQIAAIILFSLTLSILLGLSFVSLIRKCMRYYHYQKVQLQETV